MDSLPKRRKYKDNPYTRKVINNKYFIQFKDVSSCKSQYKNVGKVENKNVGLM